MSTKPGHYTHCWHVMSSVTNGLAEKGWDVEICCFCGEKRAHHWEMVNSENHGEFSPMREQRYIRTSKLAAND